MDKGPGTQDTRTQVTRLLRRCSQHITRIRRLGDEESTAERRLSDTQGQLRRRVHRIRAHRSVGHVRLTRTSGAGGEGFGIARGEASLLGLRTDLPRRLRHVASRKRTTLHSRARTCRGTGERLSLFRGGISERVTDLQSAVGSPLTRSCSRARVLSRSPRFHAVVTPCSRTIDRRRAVIVQARTSIRRRTGTLRELRHIESTGLRRRHDQLERRRRVFFATTIIVNMVLLVSVLLSFTEEE